MKKARSLRLLSVFLSAVMLFGMASVAASAEPIPMEIYQYEEPEENPNNIRPLDDEEGFIARDDVTGYSMLSDGTYKLLYDDSIAFGASIYVPASHNSIPVTVIGENAYYGKDMKHVSILGNITAIEDNAFAQCPMLRSVIIPESVKKLGKNVFDGCEDLTLYVAAGSAAEAYAIENQIAYKTQMDISDYTILYQFHFPDAATVDVKTPEGLTLRRDIDYTAESVFDWDTCDAVLTIKGKGLYTGEVIKTGHLFPSELSVFNPVFTLDQDTFVYDGTEKRPKVSLYQHCEDPKLIDDDREPSPFQDDDSETPTVPATLATDTGEPTYTDYYFTEGEDYVVSYKDNIDIGTATVTVTGIKRYKGTLSRTFYITGKSLSRASAAAEPSSFAYDGNPKTPEITVTLNGKALIKNVEYTVLYQNNINAGTATAVVRGAGNYSGTINVPFTIGKRSMSNASATLTENEFTYDGTAKRPQMILNCNGKTLAEGTDYTLSYENNINVGTATVTATGKGNYSGSKQLTFTIKQNIRPMADCTVQLSPASSYTYDGTAKKPSVTVKYGSTVLSQGTDYTVAYSNNINAGKATVTVTGKGNYSGSKSVNFTITRKALSASMVTEQGGAYYYARVTVEYRFTVSDGGKALTENTDYMVFYRNAVEAGTATVTIDGIGNYAGALQFDYTISPVSVANVKGKLNETSFNYDGTAKKPVLKTAFISSDSDITEYILEEGKDYTLSYTNNVNPGTGTVTLNGRGNYTGSKSFNFTINGVNASRFAVQLSKSEYTYNGAAQKPSVDVYYGGNLLTSGTDYSLSYSNNVNAGTATVTVTGKGIYFGSQSKNYTILPRHISYAASRLSATSYNYDGKAKTPGLTLTYSGSTLTSGTDYTLSYKNNTAPGTATVSYTGKGNWYGSGSVQFEIIKEITPFTWGVDNWNFNNTANSFNINHSPNPNDFVEAYILPSIKIIFIKQFNLDSTVVNHLNKAINTQNMPVKDGGRGGWHGSCYGMTMTEMLVKYGYLDLTTYGGNPVVYNNTASDDIISMINCFQYTQSCDQFNAMIRQKAFADISNTNEECIRTLIDHVKDGKSLVNVCFQIMGKYTRKCTDANGVTYNKGDYCFNGAHSVLAYGVEDWNPEQTFTATGNVKFDKRILIADPNALSDSLSNYRDLFCIYYNSTDYSWIFPAYTDFPNTSNNIQSMCYWIKGDNVPEEWYTGYIKGLYDYKNSNKVVDLMNPVDPDRYIAGLSVNSASGEEASVSRIAENCNTASNMMYANENDTTGVAKYQDFSVTEDGGAQPGENFALWNPTASYTLSYDNNTAMSLAMDYRNVEYYADFGNAGFVEFSPEGNVSAEGDNTSYSLSMVTSDDESVTDWTKLTVEGDGVDSVNLKKTRGGYLLTADNLQNVTVKADDTKAETSFSTGAGTVYIYEIDENTIGVLADTDGNSTFETDLAGDDGFVIGDVNSDGTVTIDDATLLQRFLCEFLGSDNRRLIETADIKMFAQADVTRDGKLDVRDLTMVQRFLAHYISKL